MELRSRGAGSLVSRVLARDEQVLVQAATKATTRVTLQSPCCCSKSALFFCLGFSLAGSWQGRSLSEMAPSCC